MQGIERSVPLHARLARHVAVVAGEDRECMWLAADVCTMSYEIFVQPGQHEAQRTSRHLSLCATVLQLVKTGANIYGVFNNAEEPLYNLLQKQFKCFPGEIFADMTSMDLSVSAENVKKVQRWSRSACMHALADNSHLGFLSTTLFGISRVSFETALAVNQQSLCKVCLPLRSSSVCSCAKQIASRSRQRPPASPGMPCSARTRT